jgi:hypothetical protein
VNTKTKKELLILQEQHDKYLLDLDPTISNEKIGHTQVPFASQEEITDTSDQLVSQKSFVPHDAKQYSALKHKNELEINKPLEPEKDIYAAPESQKDILNIGESRNKLRYIAKPLSDAQISKVLKDIMGAVNNLSARLAIDEQRLNTVGSLDKLSGLLNAIEQEVMNHELDEEFKSKAQAKYFYSQANSPGKKGKKWKKMADEFSSKTDFSKLPAKK